MESMPLLDANPVRELSFPLHEGRGWIRFLGWVSLLHGIVLGMTIVGLLVAWLPIWMGVLLLQSAKAVENAHQTGEKHSLLLSLVKLKTYFVVQGIMGLLAILAMISMMALGLTAALLQRIIH
jgi:hypothetical protein